MSPSEEGSGVRWNKRYGGSDVKTADASYVLHTYGYLLPEPLTAAGEQMRSLDLACGRGGNALYLARYGFKSDAWDISSVVIQQLNVIASESNIDVSASTRDVLAEPPQPDSYDIIAVSRFLERSLIPALIGALRPGGLIFYQTFVVGNVGGPTNPDYLLGENELLQLFDGLTVRAFESAGTSGNLDKGLRNESMIVVQN